MIRVRSSPPVLLRRVENLIVDPDAVRGQSANSDGLFAVSSCPVRTLSTRKSTMTELGVHPSAPTADVTR